MDSSASFPSQGSRFMLQHPLKKLGILRSEHPCQEGGSPHKSSLPQKGIRCFLGPASPAVRGASSSRFACIL